MEENHLPPGQTVPPTWAADSLENAGANTPVSSYSTVSKQYPLESLEVHSEGSSSSPQYTYIPPSNSIPFSRRKATIVSLMITLLVMLLTGVSATFFVNKQTSQKDSSSQLGIPEQDVDIGEVSAQLPELEEVDNALLVSGDIIAQGDIQVVSGEFVSTLRVEALTDDQLLIAPNASGTICLDVNNCNFATDADLAALAAQTAEDTDPAAQLTAQAALLADLQNQLNQIVIPPAGVTSLNNQSGSVNIQGTANRVTVDTAGGTITLSTPQDIATISSPTFGGLTLNGELTLNGDLAITGTIDLPLNCSGLSNGGKLTTNASGVIICGNDVGGGGGTAPVDAQYLVVNLDGTLTDERALQAGANIGFSDLGANNNFEISVVSNPTFSGLVTANLGLTIGAAQALTIDGSAFTSLTGTGLQFNTGSLQATLGTNIDTTEIVDGTILAVDLDSTNAPGPGVDNFVLTYDDASGGFTWVDPSSVGSGTDFDITDGTTTQNITNNDTITFADGTDIDAVVSATDTVTINNTSTLATVTGRGATTNTLLNLDGGIAVDGTNFTVNGTNGNVQTAGDITVQGGQVVIGTTSQIGQLILTDGSATGTVTISTEALSGDYTVNFPTELSGADTFCLETVGNCAGSAQNLFETIATPNGTSPIADSATDTLTFTDGTNITITGTAGTDEIDIAVVSNPTFSGLITANGNFLLEAGDTFTINGEAFTDLTGTGLQFSAGALQTTLGTSVDLTTEVTGTLPIANGGTGATTQQAAINNLSGLTTNGDLLYHNGTNSTRLARGTDGQCLLSNTTTILWGTCTGDGVGISSFNGETGPAITLNNSSVTAANTITIDDASTAAKGIASFDSTYFTVTSGDVSINDIYLSNTGDTGAGAYVFTGTMDLTGTVLQGTNALVFEGTTADVFETILAVTDPTADNTITLPDESGTVCLDSGNCAGTGGNGDILNNGQAGPVRVGTNDATSVILETGNIDRLTIDSTGAATFSETLAVQGSSVTVGEASTTNGSLVLHNSTNANTVTLQSGVTSASYALTLPTAVGSTNQCLKAQNGTGTLFWDDCDGGSGGSSFTNLTLDADTGTPETINDTDTITIAGGNGIATAVGATDTVTVNLGQLTADWNQTGAFDIVLGNAASELRILESAGATFYGTLDVGDLSSDQTFTFLQGGTVVTSGNVATFATTGVTAGSGLTGGGTVGALTLDIGAGNGITVNANDVTLALQANKGLEVDGNGLSLIDCADGQILKYETTGGTWGCDDDAGGSGVGDDVLVNGVAADGANFLNTTATGTSTAVTWSLNTVSNPDEISIAIGNASATEAGAVTTGVQTFAGAKTFNGQIIAGAGIDLGTQTLQGTTAVIDFTNFDVEASGNITTAGDVAVNGGDITSSQTTFNFLNSTVTTANLLGAATAIELGAATGTTSINNSLTVDGNTTIGNANTDTLTISAGTSGSGITFSDASFQDCLLTTDGSGVLTCASSGSVVTLQAAYDGGNTILTTDGDDIDITLVNAITTDPNFLIDIATGSTGRFAVQSNGTDVFAVTSSGVTIDQAVDVNANVDIGGNTLQGTTAVIDFTNFDVDTNGNITTAGDLTVDGNDITSSGLLRVSSNGANLASFDSGTTGNVLIGNGANSKAVTVGNTTGTTSLALQSGSGGINLTGNTDITGTLTASGAAVFNGNVTIGNANTDTLTINAGTSGSGITFSDASFQDCILTTDGSGILTCGSSGSLITLQEAYDGGNTIITTDGDDIDITLVNAITTDPNFLIDIATGSTGRFAVQSNGVDVLGVTPTGVTIDQNVTINANTNIGANTLQGTAAVIDFTNFDVDASGNITTAGDATINGGQLSIHDGTANTFTIQAEGDIGGNYTVSIPTEISGNDFFCLEIAGNCTGSSSFTITDGVTPQTIGSGDTLTLTDGTDIDVVVSATDTVTVNNTSTLATVTGRGATTTTLVNLDGGIAVDTSNFTVSGTTGDVLTAGDLAVNGGDLTSTQTTFNLLNSTVTTANLLGAATTIELGAATGTTSINNSLTVDGNTTLGNANTDTLTINAGTSGSGITLADASFANCSALTTVSNLLTCGTDNGDNISVNGAAATDANFLNTTGSGTVTAVTWSLNTVSNPDDISISIANASTTAAGAVTTGTQTFAGTKSFNGQVNFNSNVTLDEFGELIFDQNAGGDRYISTNSTFLEIYNDNPSGGVAFFAALTATDGDFAVNGDTTLGDTSGDDLVINAGSSGSGISFGAASFSDCSLTTVAGVLTCGSSSGVTTVGTIDSEAKSADGAVISGSSIVLQTADASNPGLVSTGTQTFAGEKTFNNSTVPIISERADATNGNTVGGALTLQRTYSGGVGADGIGTRIVFRAETETEGSVQNLGLIDFVTTDATTDTVDADFVLSTVLNGSAVGSSERLRITSAGHTLHQIATDSNTAFVVQDAGGQAYLTVDTESATDVLKVAIGSGTDDVVLSLDAFNSDPGGTVPDGSMFYDADDDLFRCRVAGAWVNCNGSGATNTITLIPEFGGGTLHADGSSNSGTMVADYDSTNDHTYYEWTSASGTAQDYDIVVRVPLPSDLQTIGAAGTFQFQLWDGDGASANDQIYWMLEDDDGTDCFTFSAINGSAATTWEPIAASSLGTCTFAANEVLTFTFRLESNSGGSGIRLGEFEFQYDN